MAGKGASLRRRTLSSGGSPCRDAGPNRRSRIRRPSPGSACCSTARPIAKPTPTLISSPAERPAARELELDYLKAELQLRRHGVTDTIVVFGSTRLVERSAAAARLLAAQCALAARPDDAALAQEAAISQRISDKSIYYDIAREFGALVGAAPPMANGGRLAIITGGGPGIMEAANRGALDAGAMSIGLNITLPHEQFPNPYVTPDLCLRFHYFALRKMHFLLRARALVAFPGGFGTMDELFETLTLAQTRKIAPMPIILVGEHYWRRAFDVDFLVSEGVIAPEDRELLWYAETAEEIWSDILRWCAKSGNPLIEQRSCNL